MASTEHASIVLIGARCHCGANQFKILFPKADLPLKPDLCHCTSCRHVTGTLAVFAVPMKGQPLTADSTPSHQTSADIASSPTLSQYNVSTHLTRHFCSTCGSYLFYEMVGPQPTWCISVALLDKVEGIARVGYHMYVGDTLDGGFADHYLAQDGFEIPRYENQEHTKPIPLGWTADRLQEKIKSSSSKHEDTISAYCHCQQVSLSLKRPTEAPKEEEWWHVAEGQEKPIRFKAGYCACDDCRLTSGSLFTPMLYTPRSNIINARTNKPVSLAFDKDTDAGNRIQGLKTYESSPETYREFCSKCGASVFFYPTHREGPDVDLVDVHVGLLDEEQDGSRAERWLAWRDHVSWPLLALDQSGLKVLQQGIASRSAES